MERVNYQVDTPRHAVGQRCWLVSRRLGVGAKCKRLLRDWTLLHYCVFQGGSQCWTSVCDGVIQPIALAEPAAHPKKRLGDKGGRCLEDF